MPNIANKNLSKIFYEMSELLEMQEVAFKPQAYSRAARAIGSLSGTVNEIYESGGVKALDGIPGVGKGIAEKIEEYLKTGKIKEYQKLKKQMPVNVSELTSIEGVGPKIMKLFYQKLKIRSLKDLEKAAHAGKISKLPRCGEKLEQKILKGIEFYKKSHKRFLLGETLPMAEDIKARLEKLKEVSQVSLSGSLRRQKETIGDLDILIALEGNSSKSARKVSDYFASMPEVGHVYAKGLKKTFVRLKGAGSFVNGKRGIDADLRIVEEKSFGSALQYFTGNKDHNIHLRKIAIEKGYKLNEYGLFKKEKSVAGKNEESIYKKLGMQWMPPEIRQDNGEIELAQKNKVPELVKVKDIKGDFHCHAHYNIKRDYIHEIVERAIEKGYEYIGISDHTKFIRLEHGLNEKQLLEQTKQIKKINSDLKKKGLKFRVLHGCETNILGDGSFDIDDEVLAQLDYVIAGVHSQMRMPKDEMTERIITAMRNPNLDIVVHPTGRVLQSREAYEFDFDKIFKVAKETGTVLEINSNPARLDLNGEKVRRAKEAGIKMSIGSDAHQLSQMDLIKYGVGQARRGWAEKKDIINTMSLTQIMKFFEKEKEERW